MSVKDPKPEIMRLEELALLVKGGEIKLPRFQRPFVWQRPDMLKLLDSIYKGYPIGSILVWHSSQRLTSERSIAGLEIDEKRLGSFPTNYLLDGQQRLTTLCGALFWKGSEPVSLWDIHFDLEREEFVYPKDANLVGLFPLNKLIDTGDFIRQCMKFEHHPKRQKYLEVSERLLRAIKDYKIAVVKIGDMTIEEVAPIFERINSTGRKLTIVDLMMAATWSNDFDLNREIQDIKLRCSAEGFDDLSDQVILRSIAAAAGLGINKDDIQRLRSRTSADLLRAAAGARDALADSLRFLKKVVSLHDVGFLPFGVQLTHLAEIFRLQPSPSNDQLTEIQRWFWYTSVTRYFSGANTGQNAKDLSRVRLFASGAEPLLFERGEIDVSNFLYDRFNLRNATSTAFALLLGGQRPSMGVDGRSVDETYLRVKLARVYGSVTQGPIARLNISKVIHPFSEDPSFESGLTALPQHLLDDDCIAAVKSGDWRRFAVARSTLITNIISKLTSCAVTYQPLQGVPISESNEEQWNGQDD